MGVQHGPYSFSDNGVGSGTDAVDNLRQDGRVGIRTYRRLFCADSADIGGEKVLRVAELRLNSGVSSCALCDLIQRSVVERRRKITGCRNEPVVGKKSMVVRRGQAGRRIGLDRLERSRGDLGEGVAEDRNGEVKSSRG